ncbi:hypothetical protein [Nannocystis pusilla]|uniref:hypothetical protein n=1 Tax=Nannocystis pusilla TaxID=889268 RepID=UPI003DA540DA
MLFYNTFAMDLLVEPGASVHAPSPVHRARLMVTRTNDLQADALSSAGRRHAPRPSKTRTANVSLDASAKHTDEMCQRIKAAPQLSSGRIPAGMWLDCSAGTVIAADRRGRILAGVFAVTIGPQLKTGPLRVARGRVEGADPEIASIRTKAVREPITPADIGVRIASVNLTIVIRTSIRIFRIDAIVAEKHRDGLIRRDFGHRARAKQNHKQDLEHTYLSSLQKNLRGR